MRSKQSPYKCEVITKENYSVTVVKFFTLNCCLEYLEQCS